ncbi:MAG: hypothetical protein KDC98_17525, partial [Planctomycetes bacterium]|nr:hypothetical protein [Planctomycetota bacterium]
MRILLVPSAAALAAALATGQQAVLPIQDLLYDRVARPAYLEILRSHQLCGARRFVGECYLGGIFNGDDGDAPFRDVAGRGHFGRDQLMAVLAALGLPEGASVIGGHLIVPEG